MPIPRLAATASGPDVAAALAAEGCAIVERVVPPALLAQVRAELQPYLDATPAGSDDFAGRRTRRTGGLIGRSATCRDLITHPLILDAVGSVLGHVTSFQLHLTQVIAIGPGEPAQTIHRDQWAFDFFPFPPDYDVQCNTIWAMTDFTDQNGATRLVPGSHRFEDRLELTAEQTVAAEMPAGSVLFYTGKLYHGAGANRSDGVRAGVNITYAVSWVRQEENQYLSVPADIARTLPEPLLRLMGYARGAYALGYVDDLRDPLEVLLGREAETASLGSLADAEARIRQLGT
ncbi:MAG: phytanoyl-CoA dioxygenase family protein [Deltaproteobacteria bacterium]|nr:phytanoyl-CoA dioxygenase family protein [Deltaproteobacteria bacterium]